MRTHDRNRKVLGGNIIMNKFKTSALCGVLACSMAAAALAGCGSASGSDTAITVNGETLNLGAAEFYLRYQQAETTTLIQNYGLSSGSFWDSDYTASSSEETTTYGENMKESVKDSLVETMVMSQKAGEYGVEVPDELQEEITSTAEATYTANQEALDAMGTTQADIEKILTLSTIQRLMFYPMIEDVEIEVTDEEAAQSSITYARIALTTYDSDSGSYIDATDEEKETYMAELESLLLMTQSSDDVATADMSSYANQLDSTNIAVATYSYGADDDVMPEEVLEAAATLSDGEIYDGVIDTGSYYYLVRMDAVYDEDATETERESLISDKQQEAYDEILQSWVDEAEVKVSSAWTNLKVNDTDTYLATTTSEETEDTEEVVSSSTEEVTADSTSEEAVTADSASESVN